MKNETPRLISFAASLKWLGVSTKKSLYAIKSSLDIEQALIDHCGVASCNIG